MILLALVKTEGMRGHLIINTQCTAIFIHSLSNVNYPTSPRRNSLPTSSHQYSGNFQRLFINNPKIFKEFFACKIVLAANHQQPEFIQRLFRLKICLGRKSPISQKYPKNFRQPAAATNCSNQQQQSTAATSSSNQQQQSAFILPAAPTQSTPTSVSYHYGS